MTPLPCAFFLFLSLALTSLSAADNPNMMGAQTNNVGISVVPAPKKVNIDGDLADWDLSGRIRSFADWEMRETYSVETVAMYDADNLYLAYKWRDVSPMLNGINPDFNASEGWRSDAIQMRIHTDRNLWITTWYYSPGKIPVMHLSYWKNDAQNKDGQDITILRGQPDGTDLGQGVEMAYRKDADGKGFVQEIKIPWKMLYRTVPKIEAGLVFKLGIEFIWGDDQQGVSPQHRYADNLQPGSTSRDFFWTAVRAWGDAQLVAKGDVPVREYAIVKTKPPGVIPVRFSVPEDAARMTAVIEDEKGNRVRNLVADVPPKTFEIGVKDGQRQIEVPWDGLNDAGALVSVGRYQIRGLTHGNFDAVFDSQFYNPGVPPWLTPDNTGGFGSNHASPENVAHAGNRMILGFAMSEGGHAILGYDEDDKKVWGENRGASFLAADKQFVYAISKDIWSTKRSIRLIRLGATDGSYQAFILDGKPRPFDLDIDEVLGETADPKALAVGKDNLAIALTGGRVVLLDKASAKPVTTLKPGETTALAYNANDRLFGIVDGKVAQIDTTSGEISPFPTPSVGVPKSLAFDAQGNLAVTDAGPDSNVKVFSPERKLISTLGKKGGRPVRGQYDPSAMIRVSSIAYDSKGRLWVAENWDYPRRFSVWNQDGTLNRDFVGGTNYSSTSTFLHDSDPNLAYVGPIEMKLDRQKGTWEVTRILWVPKEGEDFPLETSTHVHAQRFTSKASGTAHEYIFSPPYRKWQPYVVFVENNGEFRPVSAIGNVIAMTPVDNRGVPTAAPSGPFEGHDVNEGFFWNDLNGNGRIEKEELTFVPATAGGKKPALNVYSGWGARMSPDDLSFYSEGITRYKPTGFGSGGEPRFGPEGMETLPLAGGGEFVPVPGEPLLLNLSSGTPKTGGADGLRGIDLKTNLVKWSYPNPYDGVHGSHNAPMSRPGLIIGPLKIMGTAKLDGDIGSVFAIRGNMGEDYIFTDDGLFAGTLFVDARRPSERLPDSVKALKGKSMMGFSEGGEPFSGWFSRQSDGKVRMGTSITHVSGFIVEVLGLDSIKRFQGPTLDITAADLARAEADNSARNAANKVPKSSVIRRVPQPIPIDGKTADWARITAMEVGSAPNSASVKLAYDAENLYALFEVKDSSPMLNSSKDFTQLFKGGDAVDIQLATQSAPANRKQPVEGDLRIVMAEFEGKPTAVLMKPVDPKAPKTAGKTYSSPVTSVPFDRVEILKDAQVIVKKENGKYLVEAAIPLPSIGLKPEPALQIQGDVGFISSDTGGITNTARTYWSNQSTGLVNDLPGEAVLRPIEWGSFQFSD